MRCSQCRAEVAANARFCSSCGHEMVVVGDQRRIATVLFGDLVGFTALSETLDPEQVKSLVDRCFERLAADIDAFGGRVDKVVGDAIVALFGAPVAHEDDAERAVRAGLRMQETIASLSEELAEPVQIRIGINTGEVLVGTVRAGREYTAMGDVVNTASRLQTAAEPGMVLVGPETHAATATVVAYDAAEPVLAKGKRLPVEAWIAKGALLPPGHRPRRDDLALVGRDAELRLLTGVAETAIERTRAAMLVVHGEAGMGKSRLAEELIDRAGERFGAFVLEGRCVPYGEANVWWPVADAIRGACGIGPDADPATALAALRAAATTSLAESNRSGEIDRVVDGLGHLLGLDTLRSIDATRARDEAVRAVVALAEGYSHRQPVVVLLSDLHWAATEVLELIDTLLTRLTRRPFVIVATARRALQERWSPSPGPSNSVVLHLDPLDAEASRRFLGQLVDGELHPSLVALLVERAGGNPFYLEELASLVADRGARTVEALLSADAGELPSTLRGLVAARLDALTPADRGVLDDAAVLGHRGSIMGLTLFGEVKRGLDPEVVRAHIENLAAREFLTLDGDDYAFRSEIIREVAYTTLTKADRARSHAGIAGWLEEFKQTDDGHAPMLAHHYAAAADLTTDLGRIGGVPDDVADRAVQWLVRAAELAMAEYQPAAAAEHAGRAVAMAPPGAPEQVAARLLEASATLATYDHDRATAAAEAALADADDEATRHRAHLVLGEIAQHRGHSERAVALLTEARDGFAALGDESGVADAWRQLGMTALLAGEYGRADAALGEALSHYDALGDARGVAWAQQNLSWSAYIAGRIDDAEGRLNSAIATFERLGDVGGLTWSHGLLAWVHFHRGRTEQARTLAERVRVDARDRGERWGEAMMVMLLGSITLWTGHAPTAAEHLGEAARLFDGIDDRFGAVQARGGLARALAMSGRVAEAWDVADSLAAATPGPKADEQDWFSRLVLLGLTAHTGSVAEAAPALAQDEALRAAIPTEDRFGQADYAVAAALNQLQAGDLSGAERSLADLAASGGYSAVGRTWLALARGDLAGVEVEAAVLDESPGTYLDRALVDIARALSAARRADRPEAEARISGVLDVVDRTEDLLAQAIARLADALVAGVLASPDAGDKAMVADRRLADLGIRAEGWRRLFELAAAITPSR